MQAIVSFLRADLRNIIRDEMQRLALLAPILIWALVRFGLPALSRILFQKANFDLGPYYPFIESFFILLPPMLFGMIAGFLYLDEKDEGVISAIAITPLTRTGYMIYRLFIGTLGTLLFTIAFILLSGVRESLDAIGVASISILNALETPLIFLFICAFAKNKIQGIALSKISGVILAGPVIAFFVPASYHFLGFMIPSYWIAKVLYNLNSNTVLFWVFVGACLVIHAILILSLFKLFNQQNN